MFCTCGPSWLCIHPKIDVSGVKLDLYCNGKESTNVHVLQEKLFNISRADFVKAVYFRQGLTCTLGLTNDLIGGGQPRAKNGFGFALRRWGFNSPRLATVYQVVG